MSTRSTRRQPTLDPVTLMLARQEQLTDALAALRADLAALRASLPLSVDGLRELAHLQTALARAGRRAVDPQSDLMEQVETTVERVLAAHRADLGLRVEQIVELLAPILQAHMAPPPAEGL